MYKQWMAKRGRKVGTVPRINIIKSGRQNFVLLNKYARITYFDKHCIFLYDQDMEKLAIKASGLEDNAFTISDHGQISVNGLLNMIGVNHYGKYVGVFDPENNMLVFNLKKELINEANSK